MVRIAKQIHMFDGLNHVKNHVKNQVEPHVSRRRPTSGPRAICVADSHLSARLSMTDSSGLIGGGGS